MRLSKKILMYNVLVILLLFTVYLTSIGKPTYSFSYNSNESALFKEANFVVIGKVKSLSYKLDNNIMYTHINISVITVEKGIINSNHILIKHMGGDFGNGTIYWRSDQPSFMVGENVKVFLKNPSKNAFPVLKGAKGKASLDEIHEPLKERTAAGYKLHWYKPGVGWSSSTNRPGSDWYGPLEWDDTSIPVGYWIDTRNMPAGIIESSFITSVQSCYQTWEDDPFSYIDYDYQGVRTDRNPSNDGINIFCWRSIDGPGDTLGVASTYASYNLGDYNSLRITDSDIELDTSEPWSSAETCPSNRYDVQNTGTHEVGHTTGLADLYDSEDTEMTMYGWSSLGMISKRDLAWGDQAGIQTIYPEETHSVTVTTPGLDSAVDIIQYVEDGVPKTGSILSGSWTGTCDSGSVLSINDVVLLSSSERYHTGDTHSWVISEGQTVTVTYYHQWKPSIILDGVDGGDTVDIVERTLDGSTVLVTGVSSSPWSDWCDESAILGFSDSTSGGKITNDQCSWTVTDAFTATVHYQILYLLSDFPYPFIGEVEATAVVPVSDGHGPCGAAHTMDTMGGIRIGNRLGVEGKTVETAMDSYGYLSVYDFDLATVSMVDVESNLIVIGGPGVDQVSYYYNELVDDGGDRVLPVLFLRDGLGDFLSVPSSGNVYRIERGGSGNVVADYAVIELYADVGRYVLLVYGLGGEGTKAASEVVADYNEWSLSGQAVIVKYFDDDGDGYLDTINIVETVS